jgi:hypothetical protein
MLLNMLFHIIEKLLGMQVHNVNKAYINTKYHYKIPFKTAALKLCSPTNTFRTLDLKNLISQ